MRRSLIGVLLVCTFLSVGCRRADSAASPLPTPYPFVTATVQPTALMPTFAPPTPSVTPSPTQTPTFTPTPEATIPTETPGPTATVTATPTPLQTPLCNRQPDGVIRDAYRSDPQLSAALGCPTTPDNRTLPALWPVQVRYQAMERGHLLWLSNLGWYEDSRLIYVLFEDGTYQRFDDTYAPGVDRPSGGPDAPEGLFQPQDYLGKVWRMIPGLIERLGFGTAPEILTDTSMQLYEGGEVVEVPTAGGVFVFVRGAPNRWQLITGNQPSP